MKKPVFVGSSVAVVTPFAENGVDYAALGRILEAQAEAGTAAVTVCGTTGEAATMTAAERFETIGFCVRHACGMTVIAGAGSNCTAAALENCLSAEDAGADALLLVTPYYNKATQAGLAEHFICLADRAEVPVILYNVPSRTGMSIAPETYKLLSAHPRINGVKEASPDLGLFAEARALCGGALNFWSGNDDLTVPMMSLGAKGVVSVAANIIPGVMAAMTGLCLDGDFRAAAALQLRYQPLVRALFTEVNPIPVKAAMELLGLCSGRLRLPLTELSAPRRSALRGAMKAAGLLPG